MRFFKGVSSLFSRKIAGPISVAPWQSGRAQLPDGRYETYAREGYGFNELVFACIEELATSAAEPSMKVRKGDTWFTKHPLLELLTKPNPFMDRFQLIATIIMHRAISGNAYALVTRSGSQKAVQLWLLRPDRLRVVPDRERYIDHYEYMISGAEALPIPVSDIIHFKTRNPLDEFYGMPPLRVLSGRVDIDNYMRDFVKAFFQNAGIPAGVLNIEGAVTPETREEIKRRFRGDYGGPSGWHDLLVIDNTKASFSPMTQQMGQRGLVVPELDEISEARICAAFGVPQSLIGTRTSYQNGGYANKRAEEQHFWTGTLAPLYKELAGALNLRLAPEFGVDEVAFDLSDVRALQPDADALSARITKEVMSGVRSIQSGARILGIPEEIEPEGTYLVPANLIPTPGRLLRVVPMPMPAPAQLPPGEEDEEA